MSSDTSSLVGDLSGPTEMIDVEANTREHEVDVRNSTVGYKVQNFKYKVFNNTLSTDQSLSQQQHNNSFTANGKSAWLGRTSSTISRFLRNVSIRKYSLGYWLMIVLLAIVILTVLVIFLVQWRIIYVERWLRRQQCVDPQCLIAAGSMHSKINRSVSPCDNFYQYACGKHFREFGYSSESDGPTAQAANTFQSPLNPDVVMHLNREKSWRFLRVHRPAIDHLADVNVYALIQALHNIIRRPDPNLSRNSAKYKVAAWFTSCTARSLRNWFGSSELMHVAMPALGGSWLFDRTASNVTGAGGENKTTDWPHVLFFESGVGSQLSLPANWSWMESVKQLQVMLHVPAFVDLTLRKGIRGKAQIVLKADPYAVSGSAYYGLDDYMNKLMNLYIHDSGIPHGDMEIASRLKIFVKDVKLIIKLLQEAYRSGRTESLRLGALYYRAKVFDWKGFLQSYFSDTDINFDNEFVIYSPNAEYLKQFPRLLEDLQRNYSTPVFNRIINNYLSWSLLEAYAWHLSYEFSSLSNFHNGQMESTLEADCLIFTHELFGSVLGHIYLENHHNMERIEHVASMLSYLKKSLTDQLEKIPWMDKETRERISQRIQDLRIEHEPSESVRDVSRLNYAFRNLKVTSVYLTNLVAAVNYLRGLYNRALVGISEATEDDWLSRNVNVYDSKIGIRLDANQVFIPPGILQPPVYHHTLPPAVNFAGLGSMLGTAMAYLLGEFGSFTKEGNLWSEYSWNEYMKHWDCEYNLLRNNTQLHLGTFAYLLSIINSVIHKGAFEIIDEASGLDIAQRALGSWLEDGTNSETTNYLPGPSMSQLQLFYTMYAQTFCHKYDEYQSIYRMFGSSGQLPIEVTVNHVLSEQTDFAKAFECPEDSMMHKADHCRAIF